MSNFLYLLTPILSQLLRPLEREVVLGDLLELGVPESRMVFEILILICRRQTLLWHNWRPWFALIGVACPVGLVLTEIYRTTSVFVIMQAWTRWHFGVWFQTGVSGIKEVETVLAFLAAVVFWSWCLGFVLSALSPSTAWVSGFLLLIMWVLSNLGALLNSAVVALSFLIEIPLFLLPLFCGLTLGLRSRMLGTRSAVMLVSVTCTFAGLTTWTESWFRLALEKWSSGAIHATAPLLYRIWPYALVGSPAVYLLLLTLTKRRSGLAP